MQSKENYYQYNYNVDEELYKIPKKIHYCWFGRNEKPEKAKKCISSWQKYCSNYEIIEWNEDNFDINYNEYTRMCYEQKKYAFLSDYVRLVVIAENGGLYFDTDVELIRTPDFLLAGEAFFGFETSQYVASGLGFGSVPHGVVVEAMLAEYSYLLDGQHGTIGCPRLNTNALLKLGLQQNGEFQIIQGAEIYPIDYFNPYESATGRLKKTENTVSIHWYSASWMSRKQKFRSAISRYLHRMFGVDFFKRFRK